MKYNPSKYPLSWAAAAAIIALSLFKAPGTGLERIPHLDKAAHFCMYAGWGCCLWLESLLAQRERFRPRAALWRCVALPAAFGGCMELLQEHATGWRSGDWADLAANLCGVAAAALAGHFALRPRLSPPKKKQNG